MQLYTLTGAPDGTVAILTLVPGADLNEAVRKFSQVSFTPAEVTPIDRAAIPTDRTYRDAWMKSGEGIGHDLAKAKEIHRNRLRKARAPMLAALDVEISKALGKGNAEKIALHETERQRLRDVTADPRIEAANSIDELKAVWPL